MKIDKFALRKILKEKKITIKELVEILTKNGSPVNYAYLSHSLSLQNDKEIGGNLALAIARALSVDLTAFIENENSTPAPSVYTLKKPDENIALKIENLALKIELLEARLTALENKNRD